ncbi:hypothetical protein Ahy_A05g023652 isoform B [Arachis hypogaea]|nr:hypothetical protein Ahy_A05g023652 isoform B [Arachis hypogaea]
MVESAKNEENNASIEAENAPLLHLHEYLRTRPSEKTLKAWKILRDLVRRNFSIVYHPARHGLMRDALKHLLNLPPEEGVSLRTMSILQQLSKSFAQWSLDYDNVILKIKSPDEKAKEDLIREVKEIVTDEKALCTKLATLEQKKRELEEQINAVKDERDTLAKRKRVVLKSGKVLSERDGLKNQVPRLKAEKELTKVTEANIEAEWSKLGKQVLESTINDKGIFLICAFNFLKRIGLNMVGTAKKEDMEAFYASIEAETTPLSHLREPPRTRPSKKTLKAWQLLRDLVSKKFSLLHHPATHGLMRDTLKHLLNLRRGERVSSRTMAILQQLSKSFDHWSLDYDNANNKIKSVDKSISKAEKANQGLEANVRKFKEIVTDEKALCTKLATLEQKKRELEDQIKTMKAEIAEFTKRRDKVAKRKREVFENGKVLRSKCDGLRNKLPRLKAGTEWAFVTETNIEAEWSKLAKRVLQSTSFVEDWI